MSIATLLPLVSHKSISLNKRAVLKVKSGDYLLHISCKINEEKNLPKPPHFITAQKFYSALSQPVWCDLCCATAVTCLFFL